MRNNQPIHDQSLHSHSVRGHLPSEKLVTSDTNSTESAKGYIRRAHRSADQHGSFLGNKRLGIALGLTLGLAGTFLIQGPVSGLNLGSAHASVPETSPISEASETATTHDSGTAELIERNEKYQANHNDGAGAADSVRWVDRTASSPLVLIAPHATTQIRDGKRKPADLYTGGITEIVADRVGASSLTTTGKVSDWNKDWATRDDEFTRIIDRLPKNAVIVEIHGMKDSSLDEPVSAGTGDEPSESTDAIVGALQDEFDGHVSQDKFEAESGYTVTDYLQKQGHSVLQIELSRSLRDPKSGQAGETLDHLTRAFSKAAEQFPQLSTTPEADGEERLPHLT
ncbi:hypothetical protein [Corynebacterium sp.]|uniref:hypothetical protein n=1 Tax=Corynebacterium sp. TaxID=1720 RepID=UPI0026DD1EBC|nr:hypothetical protein [Corynebacterium sp.]MDO4914820.1 hypothetical protein [Corynebacterium sp.]